MRKVMSWLRGGGDELGWDDLVRQVVQAVAGLARFGARGQVAFPPQVAVDIEVAPGALEVVRGFAARSDFDGEVAAALANRCDCAPGDLPARAYRVVEAARTRIAAREAAPSRWRLRVEGGDRDGAELVVAPARAELPFGRGEWHGGRREARNQLVVCEQIEFVSRRAGRIHCLGSRLEVESLDQGDFLAVRRADGTAVRPSRTPSGRVAVGGGEVIELGDGRGGERAIRVRVEELPAGEGS